MLIVERINADDDYYFKKCVLAGDIKALSPEKSPIAMKDVKWSTYNSTVGFLVSGNSISQNNSNTTSSCLCR